MLQELSYQFDIVDSQMNFDKYKLIILPDVINFSPQLERKLQEYTERGGKVIGTYESLIDKDAKVSKLYGNEYVGDSYFDRDFVMPNDVIGKELYKEEYVMYVKGTEIKALESEVLMQTVKPYFNREGRDFLFASTCAIIESIWPSCCDEKSACDLFLTSYLWSVQKK